MNFDVSPYFCGVVFDIVILLKEDDLLDETIIRN